MITDGTRFGGIKLTKLYKLNKLPEWINRLNFSHSCKHFLKAMIVLLSLSIFIVTMGCFWLELVYSTGCKWYPLIVQTNPLAPDQFSICSDKSHTEQFLLGIYYSNIMIMSEG